MKKKHKNKHRKFPIQISIESIKLIYIFIFPIFGVAHNKMKEKYLLLYYEYFNILIFYISYFLSFIPLIIYIIKNRKKKQTQESTKDDNSKNSINESINEDSDLEITGNIVTNELKDKNKRERKILIIKTIIGFIVLCSLSLAYNHFNYESYVEKKTIGLAYKIPEFFLLSFLILRYKYHLHHYIPLTINTLALIAKYILTIIQSESQDYIGKHIWFYLLFSLTFCTLLVLGKYVMDKFNQSAYLIMFVIGAVMGIILISIAIIKYLIISECQIFTGFSKNVNTVETLFWFLGDVVTQFLYHLGLWITVYYFTPCHTIISENMMEIIYYIYDYKENKEFWLEKDYSWNFWLMPLIITINFICSLIFNEIIILNFCNLDYYTKIRIEEREKKDSEKLNIFLDKALNDNNNANESGASSSENSIYQ